MSRLHSGALSKLSVKLLFARVNPLYVRVSLNFSVMALFFRVLHRNVLFFSVITIQRRPNASAAVSDNLLSMKVFKVVLNPH